MGAGAGADAKTSIVYRSAAVYELIMLGLYGRHYPARYRAIAELVPERTSVLEVCCGPGILYERYLRAKHVAYTGIDLNPRFAARVMKLGGRGITADLRSLRALPAADTVVLHASLYQFLPQAAPVVERLLEAARDRLILSEPIRNLAQSRVRWLAKLAQHQTNAGQGAPVLRFDERSLDVFVGSLPAEIRRSFLIPGGREKVYVLEPKLSPMPYQTV